MCMKLPSKNLNLGPYPTTQQELCTCRVTITSKMHGSKT